MTEQEIAELAAILVNEHGDAALEVAERRREQYARERHADAYRLWGRIVIATARLLRTRRPQKASC
jgi:hypothetical protein